MSWHGTPTEYQKNQNRPRNNFITREGTRTGENNLSFGWNKSNSGSTKARKKRKFAVLVFRNFSSSPPVVRSTGHQSSSYVKQPWSSQINPRSLREKGPVGGGKWKPLPLGNGKRKQKLEGFSLLASRLTGPQIVLGLIPRPSSPFTWPSRRPLPWLSSGLGNL